ncbi:hypothetical protein MNBD_CPR01-319 [hydrothermal vent metagenome]|uniref:General secretion pathway protein M n=1 Tax=hydrothermal vent metagenome TaxID=652676 RepID=A0A3B0UTR7_9ZZZZ
MKKSARNLFGLMFAILIVSSGVFWWWHNRVSEVAMSVNTLSQEIQNTHRALKYADTEKMILSSLSGEESSIKSYFVSYADVVSFLNVLETAGRASGAKVSVTSVSPKTDSKRPMLIVSVKVKGNFDAVMRTVGAIENVPYYTIIKTITLEHTTILKKTYWSAMFTMEVGSVAGTSTIKKS